MACGCKAKSIGQPTAIKQVVRNRNAVKKVTTPTQTRQSTTRTTVARRIVRRPL